MNSSAAMCTFFSPWKDYDVCYILQRWGISEHLSTTIRRRIRIGWKCHLPTLMSFHFLKKLQLMLWIKRSCQDWRWTSSRREIWKGWDYAEEQSGNQCYTLFKRPAIPRAWKCKLRLSWQYIFINRILKILPNNFNTRVDSIH